MSTATETRTKTHARHVAAKIAGDLKRLQRFYGEGRIPSDADIENYQEELIILLKDGYLGEVSYGFKRNGRWVEALKYTPTGGGDISSDPGGLLYDKFLNLEGAVFGSFLCYSEQWYRLSYEDQSEVIAQLPFPRTEGDEPGLERGSWVLGSRQYTSGEIGVRRSGIAR